MPAPPFDLVRILAVLTGAALILTVGLFFTKLLHGRRIRAKGVRRARYIAALGELLARNAVPGSSLPGWQEDPVFLEVLFDYLGIVTGEEKATLDRIIDRLELRTDLTEVVAGSRAARRRLQAVAYLVEIAGPDEREIFQRALTDRVAEVRLHAARGLARIGGTDAARAIVGAMEHEEPWLAGRLADFLVEVGSEAVPVLANYLMLSRFDQHRDPELIRHIIRAVGLIGDLDAESVLVDMLEAREPIIRVGAASALGRAGTPASVPALLRALEDDDWRVRARAAAAVGVFHDPRAVAPLGRALRDRAWWVRQNCARALAGYPDGVRRLEQAIAEDDPYGRDAALHVLELKSPMRSSSNESSALEDRVSTGVEFESAALVAHADPAGAPS